LLFVLATVFAVRLSRLEVRNDDDQNVDGLPSYATGVHGG
ncbi:MAG: hypothetical protein RL603_39, partial [Pseudomonadota bacterium]